MPQTKTKVPTVTVTVAKFDSQDPFQVVQSGPIAGFTPIGREHYSPRASTPLRDATARFIRHMDKLQADQPDDVHIGLLADESYSMLPNTDAVIAGVNEFVNGMNDVDAVDPEAGGKVLAVILTDGEENCSHEITSEELHGMTVEREAKGWTFIYLGANQDAWDQGHSTIGISGSASGQSVNFTSSPMGTRSAMAHAGAHAQSYLSSNKAYMASAAMMPKQTVDEAGNVTSADPGMAPPIPPPLDVGTDQHGVHHSIVVDGGSEKVNPYANVHDALRKAKEKKS